MSCTWAMEAQMPTWLDLYDYRLRVAAMYRERDEALAAGGDPGAVCQRFRDEKVRLFAGHPQSALASNSRSQAGAKCCQNSSTEQYSSRILMAMPPVWICIGPYW